MAYMSTPLNPIRPHDANRAYLREWASVGDGQWGHRGGRRREEEEEGGGRRRRAEEEEKAAVVVMVMVPSPTRSPSVLA